MSIRLEGMNDLQARISALSDCDERIDEALNRGALQIEGDAKRGCPVQTGNLRASITSDLSKPLVKEVGSNVEYAEFVEYGTRYKAARPFLNSAYEANINEILEDVKQAMLGGE